MFTNSDKRQMEKLNDIFTCFALANNKERWISDTFIPNFCFKLNKNKLLRNIPSNKYKLLIIYLFFK